MVTTRGHVQVRGFAVESLRRTGDEELRYYLLQLVQALRYEAEDDSRLAAFIVSRASRNPALGILLHWWVDSSLRQSYPLCLSCSAVKSTFDHLCLRLIGVLFCLWACITEGA